MCGRNWAHVPCQHLLGVYWHLWQANICAGDGGDGGGDMLLLLPPPLLLVLLLAAAVAAGTAKPSEPFSLTLNVWGPKRGTHA